MNEKQTPSPRSMERAFYWLAGRATGMSSDLRQDDDMRLAMAVAHEQLIESAKRCHTQRVTAEPMTETDKLMAVTKEELEKAMPAAFLWLATRALEAMADIRNTVRDAPFRRAMSVIREQLLASWLKGQTTEPTQAQIDDTCLSYRHDFGIIPEDERDQLRREAIRWHQAWSKTR